MKAAVYGCLLGLLLTGGMNVMADEVTQETEVHLSASAEITLPNDEASIGFRMEATGDDPDVLRQKVNHLAQAVDQALKAAKGIRNRETRERRMQARWRYDEQSKERLRDGWELWQDEQLLCDPDQASVLVEAIEKAGAQIRHFDFRLARSSWLKAHAILEQQAIEHFRQRAARMAKALGASTFRIVRLQTDSGHDDEPLYYAKGAVMMAESSPAPMHGGEELLNVSVRGIIRLPPQNFRAEP